MKMSIMQMVNQAGQACTLQYCQQETCSHFSFAVIALQLSSSPSPNYRNLSFRVHSIFK